MKLVKFKDVDQYKRFDKLPEITYFRSVVVATTKFRDKCASSQDIEVLEDFYSRIDLTSRAISIRDEEGFYPANYFVFMPIPLYLIRKALSKLLYCGFLKDKDASVVQKFQNQVTYPMGVFSYAAITSPESGVNTKILLENTFKLKSSKRDGTVLFDFSSDEKFEQFVKDVYAAIEKFDLPNTEACCTLVGNEIAKGRSPINLKGVEKEIEKDRK